MKRRALARVGSGLLVLSALLLLPVAGAAATKTVDIVGLEFKPATVRIAVGDMVTWNNTATDTPHTATADAGGFDTGLIQPQKETAVTFTRAGTYAYTCQVAPEMHGTVIVSDASGGPAPTPPPTDSAVVGSDGTGTSTFLVALSGLLLLTGAALYLLSRGARLAPARNVLGRPVHRVRNVSARLASRIVSIRTRRGR